MSDEIHGVTYGRGIDYLLPKRTKNMTCKEYDCDKPVKSKSSQLCAKHVSRLQRRGSTKSRAELRIRGNEITLTKGAKAIVDAADTSLLNQFCWSLSSTGYAVARITDGPQLYMHRVIIGAKPGEMVDHRNGDKLDNRRANLRLCTNSQNQANRKTRQRPEKTSKYKGVSFRLGYRRPWAGTVICGGVLVQERFHTEEEAAAFYARTARELFGEFARPE